MKRKIVDEAVSSVKEHADTKSPSKAVVYNWAPGKVLSTGSTLLDLAISSSRVYGGGVPGGILMEVYGRSGSGKTSILSELGGSAQALGGEVKFLDPEARLDHDHCLTYGLIIDKACYHKPNTVTEMFELLTTWKPNPAHINVLAADSLAALSTELELQKGDKMGMRRAKEFSEGLRKTCRLIEENNWVIACSNQVRQGDFGDVTPGGKAVEFYSSLRISVNQVAKIEKEKSIDKDKKKKIKRVIGIESKCIITKSSIDKPFREVPIYIIFDYGLDDVRANLQWLKENLELTKYKAVDKEYVPLDAAIKYIEDNNLEEALRKEVIELWQAIEEKFKQVRKSKKR